MASIIWVPFLHFKNLYNLSYIKFYLSSSGIKVIQKRLHKYISILRSLFFLIILYQYLITSSHLWVINNSYFLHQFFCHINNYLKTFSNLICIILFPTLFTFKTWNIFNHNNTIFIIYNMCSRTIYSCAIFTIHTHIPHLFLRVFKSFSNFFVSG